MASTIPPGECEELPLSDAAEYILEECRMVLPGIQGLFGFQLIAVFNDGFAKLGRHEQWLHLMALALSAVAIALVMGPAAYHRQAHPGKVTGLFILVSSRLLLASMPALAVSLCLDFYLIARIILGRPWAGVAAALLFAVFFILWIVLPRVRAFQRLACGR